MKKGMYELFRDIAKAQDAGGNVDEILKKAGTDYEISGTYTPTDALNLFDETQKTTDIISKIRRVDCESTKYNLNKFVNRGVITGRDGAATAKDALLNGSDIAGITKDNIGNQGQLKELYHLFDLTPSDLTNWARIGAGRFQSGTATQIAEDWAAKLEELLFTGDGTVNQPTGILKRCLDNLAPDPTIKTPLKKVRWVDIKTKATVTDKIEAVYATAPVRNRRKSVIFIPDEMYQEYVNEQIASSGESSNSAIREDEERFLKYKKAMLVPTPDLADNNLIMTRYEDICWCINSGGLSRVTEIQNIPRAIIYSLLADWDFDFTTYDRVVLGYETA